MLTVVVLDVTTFLDGIQYCRHMHQNSFFGLVIVPHGKVEGGVLLKQSLDLEVSHLGDFFLGLILNRHVGDRRWIT
jgi:hypothetical protein